MSNNIPSQGCKITAISAARYGDYSNSYLALSSGGNITGWSYANYGDHGETTLGWSLTGVQKIFTEFRRSAALLSDGSITGWGLNSAPNYITGLNNVIDISLGTNCSLALLGNGTITGWGNNSYNLVNGGTGLTGVIQIQAGEQDCLALLNNRTITGWGVGYLHEYQDDVKNLTGVKQISIGGNGYGVFAALLDDERIFVLNYGESFYITDITGISKISASSQVLMVLLNNGTITGKAMPYFNDTNTLNGGANLTGVIDIQAGQGTPLALLDDGTVTGWAGWNQNNLIPKYTCPPSIKFVNGNKNITQTYTYNVSQTFTSLSFSGVNVNNLNWCDFSGGNCSKEPPTLPGSYVFYNNFPFNNPAGYVGVLSGTLTINSGELYFSGIETGNSINIEYDRYQHSIPYGLFDVNNISAGNLSDSRYFINIAKPDIVLYDAPRAPGSYIQYFNASGVNGIYHRIIDNYLPLTGYVPYGEINIKNSIAKKINIIVNGFESPYTAQPNPLNVLTYPFADVNVNITYNGNTEIPVDTGNYIYEVTCIDPNYYATPVTGIYSIVGSIENFHYGLSWGDNTSHLVTLPASKGTELFGVQKISCGGDFCVALMNNNSTITWGTGNRYGQQNIPYINNYIKDIAVSNNTTFILDWSGNVTGCGYFFNTLNNGYSGSIIPKLSGVSGIYPADYYLLVIPNNSTGVTTGFGDGSQALFDYTKAFNLSGVSQFGATNIGAAYLTGGKVTSLGLNIGQFGWSEENNNNIKKISCSDTSTIILYNDNTITGYGYHVSSDSLIELNIPDTVIQGHVIDISNSSSHASFILDYRYVVRPPAPPACAGITYVN